MQSADRKVAVVTGASQGIGASLVTAFREQGYAVVATSRSIRASDDPGIVAVPGDIADPATGERVVAEGLNAFGRIDTLVNNAGVFIEKPFTDYTAKDYALIIGVNLTGFFVITQRVIGQMLKQGSGHVVNISTALVDHPIAGVPSVLASLTKGGVVSATKSLAIEYATRGIRVNAVAPGIIMTPMHQVQSDETNAELPPVGHMGQISDIVGGILYLEASPFVTGAIIPIDGGRSAGH
jgi:NAD(P)-dependent dehydrogenase (short-subunit alcohol dehydrogenase family)